VQPPSAVLKSLIRRAALWRAASLRRPFRRTLLREPLSHLEIGELGERLAVLLAAPAWAQALDRNFAAPSGARWTLSAATATRWPLWRSRPEPGSIIDARQMR